MAASGQVVLDLGPFPGVSDAEFVVSGLTGIADASQVEAWIEPAVTTAGWEADGCPLNGVGYLSRGANLSGIVDSKTGIFSCWVSMNPIVAGTTLQYIFTGVSATDAIFFAAENAGIAGRERQFVVGAANNAQVNVDLAGPEQELRWFHMLASWDINANVGSLYVDDVLVDSAINRIANAVANYSACTDWQVGNSLLIGNVIMRGSLAELYFAPNQYLDFSVVANRRLFISAALQPVNLGATGSTPTGVAPVVYFHLDGGEAAQNFKLNRGTGGDFVWAGIGGIANVPSFGVRLLAQPGHSLDEHVSDAPLVRAHSPNAAGASMKIRLSERDPAPIADVGLGPMVSGNSPLLCGKWNVGWAWA